MSKLVRRIYVQYTVASKKYMVFVNCLQTGILLGSSDYIAQKYVEQREHLDFRRNLQFVGIGALFVGPYSALFFKYLNRFYAASIKSKNVIVIQKVLWDQLMFAPILVAGTMFLKYEQEGLTFQEKKLEFNDKYLDIIKNNYKLWPFLKLFKYHFVPLHHQVLYSQSFAFLWNIYVTWKIGTKRKD